MGRAKYHEYLASRSWAIKRDAVKKRAGGKCERCKKREIDSVHHLSYEHVFDEPLTDLQGLCISCHKYLSGKTAIDPVCMDLAELWSIRHPEWTKKIPISDDGNPTREQTGWLLGVSFYIQSMRAENEMECTELARVAP